MKILRNLSNMRIETVFQGRKLIFEPKSTMKLDDSVGDKEKAKFLIETYGFLREEYYDENFKVKDIKKAYGTKVRR